MLQDPTMNPLGNSNIAMIVVAALQALTAWMAYRTNRKATRIKTDTERIEAKNDTYNQVANIQRQATASNLAENTALTKENTALTKETAITTGVINSNTNGRLARLEELKARMETEKHDLQMQIDDLKADKLRQQIIADKLASKVPAVEVVRIAADVSQIAKTNQVIADTIADGPELHKG
jgi:hypothetical protein